MVFPPFYFGQIYEARCFPGALTLRPALLLELLQAVLDEIGRNGFRKIILVNAHGGNAHLLPFLAQIHAVGAEALQPVPVQRRPGRGARAGLGRIPWRPNCTGTPASARPASPWPTTPSWSRWSACPASPASRWGAWSICKAITAASGGTPTSPSITPGTRARPRAEKGRILRQLEVDALAEFIAAVKADQAVPALEREFFEREQKLR